MQKKTKDTLVFAIVSAIAIGLVAYIGYLERGYFAVASEVVIIPTVIMIIIERRTGWFTK